MRPRTLSQHHLRIHAAYSSTLGVDLGMLNYSKSSKRGPSGVWKGEKPVGHRTFAAGATYARKREKPANERLQRRIFFCLWKFVYKISGQHNFLVSRSFPSFWYIFVLMNILRLSISRRCITSLSMWFQRALPRRFGDDVGVTVLRAIDITHSYTGICARDAGSTRPWTTTRKMQP